MFCMLVGFNEVYPKMLSPCHGCFLVSEYMNWSSGKNIQSCDTSVVMLSLFYIL